MKRREFIETAAKSSALLLAGTELPAASSCFYSVDVQEVVRISQVKKPLAIAMWDFSWILRHHRYGEFENWDKALDELAERGYNAIRMDAMPQFIASSAVDGTINEEFRSIRDSWVPAVWGNDFTMSFRPREALLEFMAKCKKYHVQVGLSAWFLRHGTEREDIFMEEGGLYRAWDETLTFLRAHQMLDENVIYVDILNEYPHSHGYDWFKNEMNVRSNIQQYKLDHPEANLPDESAVNAGMNPLQKDFFNQFINGTLFRLKQKYPTLDFFASTDSHTPLSNLELTNFDALDYHVWFNHRGRIPGLNDIGSRDLTKFDYRDTMKNLLSYWDENKSRLVEWINGRMNFIQQTAEQNGLVCGNTEGWGPITWYDHPELDWSWVKESAEICIDLLQAYPNYKFICTSNFTHPQFRGMWEDIKWHKAITQKIRSMHSL